MMRFCVRLCQVLVLVGCLPNVAMAAGVACYDSHFFPVDGSTVPSNLPGVWFWPRWGIYEDSEQDAGGDVAQEVAFFVRDEDGTLEPVSFTVEGSGAPYLLVPSEGFSAGSVYQLWSQGCVDETLPASYPPPQIGLPAGLNSPIPYATITTTEMAEPPAELPAVKVAAPVREVIAYLGDCTGCGGPYDAVSVYIELAKPHGPWQDALALTTWVDDAVYQPSPYAKYRTLEGFSWVGHGRDRLSALCGGEDEQILSEGTHRARFSATIPGLEIELQSEEVAFELDCAVTVADPGSGVPDAGVQTPGEDSPPRAGSGSSAGREGRDEAGASASSDARDRIDAGADTTNDASDDGGCAVTTPSARQHIVAAGYALAALLTLRRRRARAQ